MKRLCVFAHWDRDSIIDDYVIYYLKALKEVCETIIFVSDCNLDSNETNKLNNIADFVLAQTHGEYDFGSYKRGFLLAKEKSLQFEELLFVNDSCYGPFYPLKPIFEEMENKKCDFWGMTQNRYGITNFEESPTKPSIAPHIQSYFILFKQSVFNSDIFKNFINSIKAENAKNDVVTNNEVGLSQLLYKNGFKIAVFINKYRFIHNCLIEKWDKLIAQDNFPFLKTAIIKNGLYFTGEVNGWEKVITQTNYPIKLIKQHSERVKNLFENKYSNMNAYRKIRFNLLKNAPLEIRFFVINIERSLYKILNTLCCNKLKKF